MYFIVIHSSNFDGFLSANRQEIWEMTRMDYLKKSINIMVIIALYNINSKLEVLNEFDV